MNSNPEREFHKLKHLYKKNSPTEKKTIVKRKKNKPETAKKLCLSFNRCGSKKQKSITSNLEEDVDITIAEIKELQKKNRFFP